VGWIASLEYSVAFKHPEVPKIHPFLSEVAVSVKQRPL
jgi:hypothetical protein